MRGVTLSSIRWSVFIVAALTALTGIALIVTGIYSISDEAAVLGARTLPVALIITGAIVFLVSFVGIFGTATDSKPMLWTFVAGLLVLIVVQLVVGIVALSNSGAVDDMLDQAWQKAWEQHPRVIRDIQESNSCCGFRFVTDRAVPKSSPDACLKSPEFGHQVSCYRAMVAGFRHTQTAIGVTSIVLAGLQILAVFLTYTLVQHIPDKDSTHHHGPYAYHRPGTAEPLLGDHPVYYNPYAAPGSTVPPGYVPYPYGAIGVPPAPGQQQAQQPVVPRGEGEGVAAGV